MRYDTFDIMAAYYHFNLLHVKRKSVENADAVYRYQNKILCQLVRLRYSPCLSDRRLSTLTPNAKCIYQQLIRKWIKVKVKQPQVVIKSLEDYL